MSRISILLAEDHEALRKGLRSLLSLLADLRIAGEAVDGLQAVEMAARLKPDVVLMDISMPRLNGLEALRLILARRPATRVIMLSGHAEEAYILRSESLGAAGFISKHGCLDQLPEAIRDARRGRPFFRPGGPPAADAPPTRRHARDRSPRPRRPQANPDRAGPRT